MLDRVIEKLLALQECDAHRDNIQNQLERIPVEVARSEQSIQNELDAIEAAKIAVREMEVRRKNLDTEIKLAEEQTARYKTQQLQVKKNEEYRALQHEIDGMAGNISDLEDSEIGLMLEVDEATEKAKKEELERNKTIEDLKILISKREGHREDFEAELASAVAAVESAAAELDEKSMQVYQYVKMKAKRPPFVVSLEDQKCTGCYLRVPNEIKAEILKAKELVRCNNCSRILYCLPGHSLNS